MRDPISEYKAHIEAYLSRKISAVEFRKEIIDLRESEIRENPDGAQLTQIEISRLKILLERNVITQEEFDQRRAEAWGYVSEPAFLRFIVDIENICRYADAEPQRHSKKITQEELDIEQERLVRQAINEYGYWKTPDES